MHYVFDPFEIDPQRAELRCKGRVVLVEPQVFALLLLLVENRDRMVSKVEIVEKVWNGRAVSDSAVSSRIKSARRALGDNGHEQRFIRTLHRKGLRFVGNATAVLAPDPALAASIVSSPLVEMPVSHGRPSIAVLPFQMLGNAGHHTSIGDAMAHDLIAALSRLRWLSVIARGSSFRFSSSDLDLGSLGRALDVSYCVSGVIELVGKAITVIVELLDTRTSSVLWGDHFHTRIDDVHVVRNRIVTAIIAALDILIPLNEAQAAALKGPENLDAWSAYHLGLHHLYRFNDQDNIKAMSWFGRAILLEPHFARAHAGLSSTHFQTAFLRYSGDVDKHAASAQRYAARSVELDPVDPFTNFSIGRALWLKGDIESSLPWLDRSTQLNPNYAQGFYAKAWADTVSESGLNGLESVDMAMLLSPLDPFRYAMLATRALICLANNETGEAARWSAAAAQAPGAHVMIMMIAAVAHALNADLRRATKWAEEVHIRRGDLTQAHFFTSFPFKDGELRRRIARALGDHGF